MNRNDPGLPPTAPQEFAPQGPAAYSTSGAESAPPAHAAAAVAQPPRKSWFARHKILTAILAVIALVVLVNLVNGGGEDPAPASGTAPAVSSQDDGAAQEPADAPAEADEPEEPAEADEAAPADEPEEAAPADETAPGVGDVVADGKFEFVVTEVETGVAEIGTEWLNEQAQGQFALVHVTVSNVGDRAQMFHGDNQTLVDDQGREHSANTSAAIYLEDSDSFLTDINPGNSVDAVVVFDIPLDAEPAAVELHDSMFSGGVTVSLTP